MGQPDETQREAFARGIKEGLDDATLAEHSKHLDRINGSLEELVKAEARLAQLIRDLDARVSGRFDQVDQMIREAISGIDDEVRTMQEEKRRDVTKVEATRAALAEQTETRREALADAAQQGLTQRQKLGLGLAAITVLLTILGFYLTHTALPGK